MKKFDHIGLFVSDLKIGLKHLSNIIEIDHVSDVIKDPVLNVAVQFIIDSGGLRYELVAPFGEKNPVEQALRSNKNILNHVAYKSNSFVSDINKLRENGCIPLGPPKKAKAFNGKRVIFFLTPLRMIVELVEDE